jgi:hypothetical protein
MAVAVGWAVRPLSSFNFLPFDFGFVVLLSCHASSRRRKLSIGVYRAGNCC